MSGTHAHIGRTDPAIKGRLTIALLLVSTYLLADFVGRLLTGSLALLADGQAAGFRPVSP